MKLLTHNMLVCNAKGVSKGFPLAISASKTEVRETEMNPEFLRNIADKLDWPALRGAAAELGQEPLPEKLSPELMQDQDFLTKLHRTLLEVVVVEGTLTCPESGRVFKISNAIPNMLLREDEV